MDLNKNVESPCCLTRDWGLVGFMGNGVAVPLGTFSCWGTARLAGNAWLNSTRGSDRWEAERLYVPLTGEEYADAE